MKNKKRNFLLVLPVLALGVLTVRAAVVGLDRLRAHLNEEAAHAA